MVEPMGFESASCMETKEFCGAAWHSKELKRKERNSYCPLIAPKKSTVKRAQTLFFEKCFTPIFWSRFCPRRKQAGFNSGIVGYTEVIRKRRCWKFEQHSGLVMW